MKVVFTLISNILPCVSKNLNSVTQKEEMKAGGGLVEKSSSWGRRWGADDQNSSYNFVKSPSKQL